MSLEAVGLTPDCLWEVLDESRDCWTDCRLPVGGPG